MTFPLRSIAASGILVSIAVCSLGCNHDDDGRSPTAQQVLDRMASTYTECESYSDSGKVTTTYQSTDGDQTEVKPFTTAMIRPDQFRFEFTVEGDPRSRFVVWQSGKQVRTWWDVSGQSEQPESLGMGLAGATGVSSESAHTIPALLMPRKVGGRLLTDVRKAKRGEDRKSAGHACFTIEAQFAGDPIAIWVDQETYLVRRIDSKSKFDDFTTQTSTTYDPVINEEIDPSLLEFQAPR